MSRLHTILADVQDIAAYFGVEPVPVVDHADEMVEGKGACSSPFFMV